MQVLVDEKMHLTSMPWAGTSVAVARFYDNNSNER